MKSVYDKEIGELGVLAAQLDKELAELMERYPHTGLYAGGPRYTVKRARKKLRLALKGIAQIAEALGDIPEANVYPDAEATKAED